MKPLHNPVAIQFFILPLLIFLAVFLLKPGYAFGQQDNLTDLFFQMKCDEIIKLFKGKEYHVLPLNDQLIFVESAVVTGQMDLASQRMGTITRSHPQTNEVLQTMALISLAKGRFIEAEKLLETVLARRKKSLKALLWKVMVYLYRRKPDQAREIFSQLTSNHPQVRTTTLVYVVGIEVFNACGDMKALGDHYKFHLKHSQIANKTSRQAIKANSRFYKKIKSNGLFQIDGNPSDLSIPMLDHSNGFNHKMVRLNSGSKDYKIILDTGNSVGWFIHDRDLNKILMARQGGRVYTTIGSQSGLFDGYRILTNQIDFKKFRVVNCPGIYVPKPNRGFYDANLNPLFLKERVIYLDFISQLLTLKSKERHQQYISGIDQAQLDQMSWFGYEHAYVEVFVFGQRGLAMIETGAEDVTLNLAFAKKLKLGMTLKTRYLANGSKYQYYTTTPVTIKFNHTTISRSSTQAWSLRRFRKRITGLTPDIILGPQVFSNDFQVVFDPFDAQILLIKRK